MKYFTFILLLLCFSCKSVKLNKQETTEYLSLIDNYKKQIESLYNTKESLEKSLYIYKDSLIQERALKESSQSFGLDSSFLETTYAESFACIKRNGKLFHNIKNNDSIPTKIIYIKEKEEINNKDSTNFNKQESKDSTNIQIIYKDKEIIKEVTPFWSKLKNFCIGFVSCLFVIFIIWIVFKIKGIKFKFIKL